MMKAPVYNQAARDFLRIVRLLQALLFAFSVYGSAWELSLII